MILWLCIGINIGVVLALVIMSDFKMDRFRLLCEWVIFKLEDRR